MTAKQAEDGARRCQAPALSVRPAKAEDLGAFLELARLCVADRCLPFSEDQARYVFAGIGREDLCIYLLVAGAEAQGFSIVQSVRVPLTSVVCLREELLFVRAELRSTATEGLLHALTISLSKASKDHHEVSLYIAAGPHALEVVDELREIGFRDAGLRMEAVHKEDGGRAGDNPCRLN